MQTQSLEQSLAAARAEVVWQLNGRDVTRGELNEAFNQVADKGHWKNPINAEVELASTEHLETLRYAVVFFTGSKPRFERIGRNRYRITAAGYFKAIGA